MDLDVVFLGTSASAPTASRGASATLLRRGGDRLLVDCGEGTQRQLLRSDTGLVDLEHVFLTHLHADHVLGLPGMLKTFALRGREVPVTVYGPSGTAALMRALGVVIGRLTYPFDVVELDAGAVIERDDYRVETFAVEHGRSSLGYALREDDRPGRFDVSAADALGVPDGPSRGALQRGEVVELEGGRVVRPEDVLGPPRRGRTIVLSGDTAPTRSVVEAAQGADVLVHEATFLLDEREQSARDGSLDHRGRGRCCPGGGGSSPRPHAPLGPLRGNGGRRGGGEDLPVDRRPARLRPHRRSVPGAR